MKCKYCFQLGNEPEKVSSAGYHSQPQVRADKKIVDNLVRYCLANNVTHVEIFGGEPLYYRDTFEYSVTSLCESVPGMTIGVITNGTLITETILRIFETLPVSILLSLDGGRERHNELRGGFNRISRWFERLVAQGHVSVAIQAGVIQGLYENIRYIWGVGFPEGLRERHRKPQLVRCRGRSPLRAGIRMGDPGHVTW